MTHRGVIKFNDDNNRSHFNSDYEQLAATHRLRLCAATAKTSIRAGYGSVLHSSPERRCSAITGTGFTLNSPADLHSGFERDTICAS